MMWQLFKKPKKYLVIVVCDDRVNCGLYNINHRTIEPLEYKEFQLTHIIMDHGIIYNTLLLKKYVIDFVKNTENIEGIVYVLDYVTKKNTLVFYTVHIQCLIFSHLVKISFVTILSIKKISTFAQNASYKKIMLSRKQEQLSDKKNSVLHTYSDAAIHFLAKELI